MELPRDPQQIMKPGSYSRPVPKVLTLTLYGSKRLERRATYAHSGLIQSERHGHELARATKSSYNGLSRELFDLGQAANLRPQTDVHGHLL